MLSKIKIKILLNILNQSYNFISGTNYDNYEYR